MVVSFGGFIDDSAAYADWILPDHHPLESAAAVVPAVSPRPAITVAVPFVQPLYDTRPIEQTLGDIARKVNLGPESVTPRAFAEPLLPGDQTWNDVVRQGGLWMDNPEHPPAAKAAALKLEASDAIFSGDAQRFPLLFQPYLSLQYHDGCGANLPWMQELPDPVSSSIWGLPVEIDPQTAARLRVANGDMVRVESAHGSGSAGLCPSRRDSRRGEHGDRRRTHALWTLRFRPRSESAVDSGAGLGEVDRRSRLRRHARASSAPRRKQRELDPVFDAGP